MPNLSETGPLHGPTPGEIIAANGKKTVRSSFISKIPGNRALRSVTLAAVISTGGFIASHQSAEADCGSSNPNYICPKNAPERPPTGPNIPGGYPTITTSVPTPGSGVLSVDAFEDQNYDGVRQLPTEGRGLVTDITVFNQNGSLDAKTTLNGNGANMGLSAGIKRVCAALAEGLTRFTTYGGGQCVDNVVVPAGGTVTVLFGETGAPGYLRPQIPNVPTIAPGTRLPGLDYDPPISPIPHTKETPVPTPPKRTLPPTGMRSGESFELIRILPSEGKSAAETITKITINNQGKVYPDIPVLFAPPSVESVRLNGVSLAPMQTNHITREPNEMSQLPENENNLLITAHRGNNEKGQPMLGNLIAKIKTGDTFTVTVGGKEVTYKAIFAGVVADARQDIKEADQQMVTFVTCDESLDWSTNTRVIVHAVRADGQAVPTATAGQTKAENGGQTDNGFRSTIGGLAVLLLAGLGVYTVGKRN